MADAKRPWWQIGNTPTLGFVTGGIWAVMAVLRWGNVAEGATGSLGGLPAQLILAVLSTVLSAFALTSAVLLRRRRRAAREAADPAGR